MLHLEATERTTFIKRYEYQHSRRRIMFTYTVSDNRWVWCNYIKTLGSHRHILCFTDASFSERFAFREACIATNISNRVCICAERIGTSNERTCTYTPGARLLFFTVPTHLPITYLCERGLLCHTDPISQRYVMLCYTEISDRHTFVQRVNKCFVYARTARSCIKYSTERQTHVQLVYTHSQRVVSFPLTTQSERLTQLQRFSASKIYTTNVVSTIKGLYTERTISVKVLSPYSERFTSLTLVPSTERVCMLAIRMFNERMVSTVVHMAYSLYAAQVVQAVPHISERHCVFSSFIYSSERECFIECRDLYARRTPNTVQDPIILKAVTDDNTQTALSTDRSIEITGSTVAKHEVFNKLTVSKTTISSYTPVFSISAVDAKGASINTDNVVEKKTLLSTSLMRVNITIV